MKVHHHVPQAGHLLVVFCSLHLATRHVCPAARALILSSSYHTVLYAHPLKSLEEPEGCVPNP